MKCPKYVGGGVNLEQITQSVFSVIQLTEIIFLCEHTKIIFLCEHTNIILLNQMGQESTSECVNCIKV